MRHDIPSRRYIGGVDTTSAPHHPKGNTMSHHHDLDQWNVEQDARRMQAAQEADEAADGPWVYPDEHGPDCGCGCQEPVDPAYEAHIAEMEKREAEGYPVGAEFDCYGCGGFDGHTTVKRRCVATSVSGGSDPTQVLELECGHYAI